MKGRYELLNDILEGMRKDNPGLDAVAVVTSDGMPVVSLMKEADELKVSAMAATLQSVAEQVVKELRGGNMAYLAVKSDKGTILVKSLGKDFILVMLISAESKLGYALWQAESAGERISKVLSP